MADEIVWNNDMSVGFTALDNDHKVLIQALNDFIRALENDEGIFAIDGVFSVLLDYTHYHFSREEAVLETCGYGDLKRHKKSHVELKNQLIDARRRYMLNPSTDLEDEIRDFLLTWLQKHILIRDMDYKEALVQSGQNVDAILASMA